MFYDFIYLAKGFRMRPKVRSTLSTRFNFFYNLKLKKKSLNSQGKHSVTWTKTFNIKPILANSCEEIMVNDHN